MKKYLLGASALTIAVCFSAFVSKKQEIKVSNPNITEDALYWYPVNSSTDEIDHNSLINPSVKLTKSEMREEDKIPCEEGSGTDCIRGFTSLQSSDHAFAGQDAVEKTE